MDVAEANESPRPAEPELTFQWDGVRLTAERTFRLATGKELEARGAPASAGQGSGGTAKHVSICHRTKPTRALIKNKFPIRL
jgi:hypothetical protein